MKVKNIFSLLVISFSIICIFINLKVFNSNLYQAYLLYDYNNEKFLVPNKIYSEKLDDDFPNLTFTALPIKVLKARYYIELDSLKIAKSLLFQAMNENPYLMASEEMLSRIYLDEQKLDSAYFFGKKAFNNMPNVNKHRQTYFTVLRLLNDSINVNNELDSAFEKIKNSKNSKGHWYDYIYSKYLVSGSKEITSSIIEKFKKKFPNEDNDIIKTLENRVEIGSTSFQYFSLLSALADDYFKKEDYIKSSEFYEKAIDFNPNNYLIYENLAISYDLSNRLEKAIQTYDIVINDFNPVDGRVEFYKGLLLIRVGQKNDGCEYLKRSSKKNYFGSATGIRASEVFQSLCVNN